MCGITGYVGPRPAVRTVVDMLRRLEYRGYDSAGVAVAGDADVSVIKAAGKLAVLEGLLSDEWEKHGVAIAHTRWATHGGPTTPNAHPHYSGDGAIALIHNGIIENYQELKTDLIGQGFVFTSDTDTEVMVHLVDRAFQKNSDMERALREALGEVTGAYSVAVVSTHAPGVLFCAKTASPLILGLGENENFLASDIPAVMRYTRRVIVLEDGDFAVVTQNDVSLSHLDGTPITREPFAVTWDEQTAEKGGYPHFMLKEIHEQPRALADTFRGRITPEETVRLLELSGWDAAQWAHFTRIQIVACGTAYHAGVVAKKFFEHLLKRPTEVSGRLRVPVRRTANRPGNLVRCCLAIGGNCRYLGRAPRSPTAWVRRLFLWLMLLARPLRGNRTRQFTRRQARKFRLRPRKPMSRRLPLCI